MESTSGSKGTSEAESGDDRGALYDFIYLDRARIASYHAQLTNLGAWTGTTTTEGTTDSKTTTGVAKIPPDVFGGTIAVTKGSTDGYQRQYDPALLVAIDTIERLDDEGSISMSLNDSNLGSLFVAHGTLSILDVRLIQKMWDSVAALMIGQQPTVETPSQQNMSRNERKAKQRAGAAQPDPVADLRSQSTIVAEIAKNLPHPVQATLITANGENLWTVLETESFIGTPDAMTLKHGASITGEWSVFGLLDARPDVEEFSEPFSQDGQGIASMLRGFQEFIRQQFGRPLGAYAMTPLAIYRPVPRGDKNTGALDG